MQKAEILKELKEISNMMSENMVDLWTNDVGSTVGACATDDVDNTYDDGQGNTEGEFVKYNGWNERFENLIKKLEE